MDPFSMLAIGSSVGSLLGDLFGGGSSGEKRVENNTASYLDQLPKILKRHYGTYEQAGALARPILERHFNQLTTNPTDFMNKIGNKYRVSPGYEFKTREAIKAANQAASAAGMLGSPSHQQIIASQITGLADQDYYNYLQNALGLYGMGLQGYGNLYQTGYGAASNLGDNLANAQMTRANLAHSTGQNELTRNRSMWGSLGNILGQIGGNYLGNQNQNYIRPDAYWTGTNASAPINTNNFLNNPYSRDFYGR